MPAVPFSPDHAGSLLAAAILQVLLPSTQTMRVASANYLGQDDMGNGPQVSDPDRMRLELQQSAG